jgi:hypothetical protein
VERHPIPCRLMFLSVVCSLPSASPCLNCISHAVAARQYRAAWCGIIVHPQSTGSKVPKQGGPVHSSFRVNPVGERHQKRHQRDKLKRRCRRQYRLYRTLLSEGQEGGGPEGRCEAPGGTGSASTCDPRTILDLTLLKLLGIKTSEQIEPCREKRETVW